MDLSFQNLFLVFCVFTLAVHIGLRFIRKEDLALLTQKFCWKLTYNCLCRVVTTSHYL